MNIQFHSIGTIYTPYISQHTPYQPLPHASGEFWITLNPEYAAGLDQLAKYRYLYVFSYMHKTAASPEMTVSPPWAPEMQVGLFASRSPNRPNPLGLSIVEIKEISGNDIVISGIDVLNGTPLLDLKPYIHSFDVKENANDGWFDDLPDKAHRLSHLMEQPHDHPHEHHQEHAHTHQSNHHHAHTPNLEQKHEHEHAHEHSHKHQHVHNHQDFHPDHHNHDHAADQKCEQDYAHVHEHEHIHNHSHHHGHE